VNRAASLGGHERLRLFFGLPIPSEPASELARWARRVLAGYPGARALPVDDLHVTLAFLGQRPAEELDALREALREAAAGIAQPVLVPARYRETERVAMLVFDDEGGHAALLQERLAGRLERLGVYRRERRPWLAHVTVARFRNRPRASVGVPELGRISPSEAALYHSTLRPSGAQYQIVDAVSLGGSSDDRLHSPRT
jgi:2'-5' RNA ligase